MGSYTVTGLSIIKKLTLYEFALWGRDTGSVVPIREGLCYKGFNSRHRSGTYGILAGQRELSVTERCPFGEV